MANTFFGFNTSLNDHDRLDSSPEDLEGECLEAEEEYDALNDETFGGIGSDLGDDWEVQHEQLAEIAESTKHSLSEPVSSNVSYDSFINHVLHNKDDLDRTIRSVLSLDDDDELDEITESIKQNKDLNDPVPDTDYSSISDLIGIGIDDVITCKEDWDEMLKFAHAVNLTALPTITFKNKAKQPAINTTGQSLFLGQPQVRLPSPRQIPPSVRTVEELERMLINQSKPVNSVNNAASQNNQFSQQPGQFPMPPRYPPGFQPMVPPPQHPHHSPGLPTGHPQNIRQYQYMPPNMMRMMGPHANRVPPPHMRGPPPPPGFPMYYPHPNSSFPMNPHFNFPPAPRVPPTLNNNRQVNSSFQQQQKVQRNGQYRYRDNQMSGDIKDEYAGLMRNREKNWLLNIQLLQVNTGTPYFDDYYYTVFKERQAKNNKENLSHYANSNNPRYRQQQQQYHNGGNRYHNQHHRDGNAGHRRQGLDRDRPNNREQENPLKPKTYTPLQFENSLGKLQFASVTAPRKIIDMDIINLDKDADSPQSARDSRKTKQLLLELEALYSVMLRAEDLKNPLAISNIEKLKELKQKQRLREIEAAPTPEQKQEVLKLLQEESKAVVENQQDLLNKIVHALLQDEKLSSFVVIRKGKMLLLRLLPHLALEIYSSQLLELWIKLLLSVSLVGRRDTIGDNILPRFHPHFKRFINICEINKILEIVASLRETIKLENNRSTPLIHQSKSPLHFILSNKFGISSLASVIMRVEILADTCTEKQLTDWCSFLTSMSETITAVGTSIATPLEPITTQIMTKHLFRFNTLSQDKKCLIEKVFGETD